MLTGLTRCDKLGPFRSVGMRSKHLGSFVYRPSFKSFSFFSRRSMLSLYLGRFFILCLCLTQTKKLLSVKGWSGFCLKFYISDAYTSIQHNFPHFSEYFSTYMISLAYCSQRQFQTKILPLGDSMIKTRAPT